VGMWGWLISGHKFKISVGLLAKGSRKLDAESQNTREQFAQ
jgi:hypothetical protein